MAHDSQRSQRRLATVLTLLLVVGSVLAAVIGAQRVATALDTEVRAALASVDAGDVRSAVNGRDVILAGTVATDAGRRAVEAAVQQVPGIGAVSSSITVVPVDNASQEVTADGMVAQDGIADVEAVGSEATTAHEGAPDERAPVEPVTILFATGAVDLSRDALAALRPLAERLQGAPARSVAVTGYVSLPHDGDQREHSLARARAVAQALVRLGVPEQAMVVRGRGAADPVASNQTEAGRLLNQRVTVTVKESS